MSKYLSRDYLRKLDPVVFEEAAELIRAGKEAYSCLAISTAGGFNCSKYLKHVHAYEAAFKPQTCEEEWKHPFWDKSLWHCSDRHARGVKRERINALLMMAAMVRYAKEH